MDGTRFDALTRRLGRWSTRRQFFGLLGGLIVGAVASSRPAAALGAASTQVQTFYELVDAYQDADAYALLGAKWQAQQSLAAFTTGYADTAFVQCTITGEQPVSGGTAVAVQLIAWHNDGTIQSYMGHYTVGLEQGKLLILAGAITPSATPSGTPRLCTISDLAFGLGQWTAGMGNRFSAVIATNIGGSTCVVGGSPRVTLSDSRGATVRSTSQAGSPPLGITLPPGGVAHAPLRFDNWCGRTTPPFAAAVEVPGDTHRGSIDTSAGISLPPCLGPGEPAALDVQAWLAGSA